MAQPFPPPLDQNFAGSTRRTDESSRPPRSWKTYSSNKDQFLPQFDGVPFEGAAFRLFNPRTRLWSIYWADSNLVTMDVPQVGFIDGNIGRFHAQDLYAGKPIVVVTLATDRKRIKMTHYGKNKKAVVT